jgi:hypothetical protein
VSLRHRKRDPHKIAERGSAAEALAAAGLEVIGMARNAPFECIRFVGFLMIYGQEMLSLFLNEVQIVESFWVNVWVARNARLATATWSMTLSLQARGKRFDQGTHSSNGYASLQTRVGGLEFEIIESFQNGEGNSVASRWRVRGRNNGFLGLPPDQRPLEMTGPAVWAVGSQNSFGKQNQPLPHLGWAVE